MFILRDVHIKSRHLGIYYGFGIALNAINHMLICFHDDQQILWFGFPVVDPFIICHHYKTSGKKVNGVCAMNIY